MSWHAANICKSCWIKSHHVLPSARLKYPEETKCCFCGKMNTDGLFVREDTEVTKCNH